MPIYFITDQVIIIRTYCIKYILVQMCYRAIYYCGVNSCLFRKKTSLLVGDTQLIDIVLQTWLGGYAPFSYTIDIQTLIDLLRLSRIQTSIWGKHIILVVYSLCKPQIVFQQKLSPIYPQYCTHKYKLTRFQSILAVVLPA